MKTGTLITNCKTVIIERHVRSVKVSNAEWSVPLAVHQK